MVGSLACSVGSCETVNTSKWATFLGIPVAGWGVAFYVGMFVLAMISTREQFEGSRAVSALLLATTGAGLLFSAWLTWLELFVIRAICQWCVVSALLVLAMFVLAMLDYRETARPEVARA